MKKRILAAVLLALTVITATVGCGKKVECDFCGEVKSGKTRTIFGEEVSICNDCVDDMRMF